LDQLDCILAFSITRFTPMKAETGRVRKPDPRRTLRFHHCSAARPGTTLHAALHCESDLHEISPTRPNATSMPTTTLAVCIPRFDTWASRNSIGKPSKHSTRQLKTVHPPGRTPTGSNTRRPRLGHHRCPCRWRTFRTLPDRVQKLPSRAGTRIPPSLRNCRLTRLSNAVHAPGVTSAYGSPAFHNQLDRIRLGPSPQHQASRQGHLAP
jgi:hypothetical protein